MKVVLVEYEKLAKMEMLKLLAKHVRSLSYQ